MSMLKAMKLHKKSIEWYLDYSQMEPGVRKFFKWMFCPSHYYKLGVCIVLNISKGRDFTLHDKVMGAIYLRYNSNAYIVKDPKKMHSPRDMYRGVRDFFEGRHSPLPQEHVNEYLRERIKLIDYVIEFLEK